MGVTLGDRSALEQEHAKERKEKSKKHKKVCWVTAPASIP